MRDDDDDAFEDRLRAIAGEMAELGVFSPALVADVAGLADRVRDEHTAFLGRVMDGEDTLT